MDHVPDAGMLTLFPFLSSPPPQVMVVQPTYPLTAGLSLTSFRSVVTRALDHLERLPLPPEWVDEDLMRERGWPGLREALVAAHNPQEEVRDSACLVLVLCDVDRNSVYCGIVR